MSGCPAPGRGFLVVCRATARISSCFPVITWAASVWFLIGEAGLSAGLRTAGEGQAGDRVQLIVGNPC